VEPELEPDALDNRRGLAPVVYAVITWALLLPLLAADIARPVGSSDDSGCLDICFSIADWIVIVAVLFLPTVFFALLARVAAASDERHFGDAVPQRVRRAKWAANAALLVLTGVLAEFVLH
jgi:hypothetical protein